MGGNVSLQGKAKKTRLSKRKKATIITLLLMLFAVCPLLWKTGQFTKIYRSFYPSEEMKAYLAVEKSLELPRTRERTQEDRGCYTSYGLMTQWYCEHYISLTYNITHDDAAYRTLIAHLEKQDWTLKHPDFDISDDSKGYFSYKKKLPQLDKPVCVHGFFDKKDEVGYTAPYKVLFFKIQDCDAP